MKKSILIISAAIVVATTATVNVTLSNSKTKNLSKLALANVEALADNEKTDPPTCGTYGESSWDGDEYITDYCCKSDGEAPFCVEGRSIYLFDEKTGTSEMIYDSSTMQPCE